ncbi:MAG: response regulator [Bdellovibrionales bacterium]|nr:response regulator [Bdellovibrionales bacterium]
MAKKIVVAEDSVVIQKSISITLSQEDVDLHFVGNGRDALSRILSIQADMLITDLSMPQMDGIELCENIRSNPQLSRLPILMMAGAHEPIDLQKAQSKGASDFIHKPFQSHEIVAKVRQLLSTSQKNVQDAPTTSISIGHTESLPSMEHTVVEDESLPDIVDPSFSESTQVAEKPAFEFSQDDELTMPAQEVSQAPSSPFHADYKNFESSYDEGLSEHSSDDLPEDSWTHEKQNLEDWSNPKIIDTPQNAHTSQAQAVENISEEVLERIIRSVSSSLIEKIAWEVVPELAEKYIKEEIARLTKK